MFLFSQYDSRLNYLRFGASRCRECFGYHLSKANDESYYLLYDLNPYSVLNPLRFCRKEDLNEQIQRSSSSTKCQWNSCRSECLQTDLSAGSDDLRFGLYACQPKESLASIVYTQSFPRDGQ